MPLTRAPSTAINTAITAVDTTNIIYCNLGNYFTKSISANTTFSVANVPTDRTYSFTLELLVSSGTVTWWTGVVWPLNAAPLLTTSLTNLLMFVTDNGGITWRGSYLTSYSGS